MIGFIKNLPISVLMIIALLAYIVYQGEHIKYNDGRITIFKTLYIGYDGESVSNIFNNARDSIKN